MAPQAKRAAALRAAKHALSQRRACNLASVDPKTVRRERVPDCPEIRQRMREIASERRRFGYRRIGVMLAREGMAMNHKKAALSGGRSCREAPTRPQTRDRNAKAPVPPRWPFTALEPRLSLRRGGHAAGRQLRIHHPATIGGTTSVTVMIFH